MVDRILAVLQTKKEGASFQGLARAMHCSSREKHRLKKYLQDLESQGIVIKIKRRYFVPVRTNVVRGKFMASSRGFGFVGPGDGRGEDIFIPAKYTGGALDGDYVEVLFKKEGKKGKPEGRILRILEKSRKKIIGFYKEKLGRPFFLPIETPFSEEIPLVVSSSSPVEAGMIVEAERETMRLTDILGWPDEPGVDTEAVIRRFGLRAAFSKDSLEETENIPAKIPSEEKRGRIDYRNWTSVTIDGETAQDFDDAVSVERLSGGNYRLGVHIADVSYYVQPDSALDEEAFRRGTSVYFSDRTLPMLPEALSTDICSLRPQRERLTLSVVLEIDREGNVLKSAFHPSLIRTKERLTYDFVQQIFDGVQTDRSERRHLVPDLLLMRDLSRILNAKRRRQGSLDFDLTEPELIYREGNLVSIVPFERLEAHRVIEEFMVLANEAVASYLVQKNTPSLFRVHPRPGRKDLERLREILEPLGFFLPPVEKIRSKDLQSLLNQVDGHPAAKFLNLRVLKSLKLAQYSDENRGHYGLAKRIYTHFTSPIRRYPDLIVHRILKSVLRGEKLEIPLSVVAAVCSEKERRAEEAERELMEWRIFRLLKEKLGEEVQGVVVDINRAGLVVDLDGYFVEGMVFFSDLRGDYRLLRGQGEAVERSTGNRIGLGDRVKGILASVDPVLRRISLTLASGR